MWGHFSTYAPHCSYAPIPLPVTVLGYVRPQVMIFPSSLHSLRIKSRIPSSGLGCSSFKINCRIIFLIPLTWP